MHEGIRDKDQGGSQREVAHVADRLSATRRRNFVGRSRELDQLEQCASIDGPAVTFLHGIGGMGKSALLEVLVARFGARGVQSIYLDARALEPTPRGFWQRLGGELGLCDA